jgi:hypothetical protein
MSISHEHAIADISDIPSDDNLPGLRVMLDAEKFRGLIQSRIGDSLGTIDSCAINYIRYKPGTNCLVAYELSVKGTDPAPRKITLYGKLYAAADYTNALEKSRQVRWIDIPGAPSTLPLDEQLAILYFYPNDCLIDGLRLLSDLKKIQRLLYERLDYSPSEEWRISDRRLKVTMVRYKPERRAVVRIDTKRVNRKSGEKKPISIYLRFYSDDRGAGVHSLQKSLFAATESVSGIAVPRPLAYITERKLLMLEAVEGVELLTHLMAGDRGSVALAATAISELHRCVHIRPPFREIGSLIENASATGDILRRVAPETSRHTSEIVAKLSKYHSQYGQSRMAFVHGDYYYGQVLIQGLRAAIIDFDRSYFGEAAADIGNFCAHLRLLGIEGRVADTAGLESEFLDAYRRDQQYEIDANSMRFYLAYGLFLLAIGPFRRLEARWKQKTHAILDECQRILQ